MKRIVLVVALLWASAAVVMGQTADGRFSLKNSFNVFALYSNDSSPIIVGITRNRKIAGVGFGYSRRLAANKVAEWAWEFEARPLNFVRDPLGSGESDVTILGSPVVIVGLPQSGPFSGTSLVDCVSGTTVVQGTTSNGVAYQQTITQQCSDRWTYAGGINPLGQRISFAKQHRLQPFLAANAGMLISPRDVPYDNSSRVNFTFEGGAGVQWFRDGRHVWAVDARLHHLSNAFLGYNNPGIDSVLFRVSYGFGR